MLKSASAQIAIIGIDIAKNSFHVVGHNNQGAIVLRQKWSRGQIEAALKHAALPDRHLIANLPWGMVGAVIAVALLAVIGLMLERGIVVRQGIRFLRTELP